MVTAMQERDAQHANHNRFAELCAAVLNGFNQSPAQSRGTMVVLHVRRSSAFFQTRDPQEGAAMSAMVDLCMQRRAEATSGVEEKPLVLCVISRESVLKD